MSDLPAPLTPADCDLRGFEWMAIHGHRLFTSGWYLAAMKDPRGGIAALKLWWAAMLQCPAGSLPSDEEELCLLADFGQDMKAWKKHRAVAMRGFILCQDHRYYHPVVAEQAIKAYESRLKAAVTRQSDAERLRRWRASNGSHPPEKPNGQAPPETPDETRFRPRFETHNETPDETHSETRTKRDRPYKTGTETREKKESKSLKLLTSSPVLARAEAPPEAADQAATPATTDALEALMDESGIEKPQRIDRSNDAPASDDPVILAHIKRVTKACSMSIPFGEVRSVEAQLQAIRGHPGVVGAEASMGLKWLPAEPANSVETQIAAALAGCSSEQIAKATAYATRGTAS